MAEMYREFSRAVIRDNDEELVADTSVHVTKRGLVKRVYSLRGHGYVVWQPTGDPVEDERSLMKIKRRVAEYDAQYRGPRPVPKPQRETVTFEQTLAQCPHCGGSGIVTDESGEDVACRCRR